MLRILNSLCSFCDEELLLQDNSVKKHDVFFFPPDLVKVSLGVLRAISDVHFSASVSLGSTFFVFQEVRVWQHDCYSSWSHCQGLRWRRSCSARTLVVSAKISSFFHNCTGLFLFPSMYCTRDSAAWRNFRGVRSSLCCSCRRVILVILCFACWSSASGSSPEGRIPCAVVLELLDQLVDLVLTCCILLFNCRKWYAKNSVVNFVLPGFTVTLRVVWWVPRWSCVLASWILLTVLRVRFEYNPWHSWSQANLSVELILCFRTCRFPSVQAAGSVL